MLTPTKTTIARPLNLKSLKLKEKIYPVRLYFTVKSIKNNNMDIFIKDREEIQALAKDLRRGNSGNKLDTRIMAKNMGFQIMYTNFKNPYTMGSLELDVTLPEQSKKIKSDKLILLNKKLSIQDQNLVTMTLLTKYIFECPIGEKTLFRTKMLYNEESNKKHEKMQIFVDYMLLPDEKISAMIESANEKNEYDVLKMAKQISESFCVPIAFAKRRLTEVHAKTAKTNRSDEQNDFLETEN